LPEAAPNLFSTDRAACERARRAFLAAVPAFADGWAPFVSSSERTLPSVPPAVRTAWRLLGADALAWARSAPEQPLAWLRVLLPSLLLHHPAPAAAASATALTSAARATDVFAGAFPSALADRDAGVWRYTPRTAAERRPPVAGDTDASVAPGKVTAGQRRALRLVKAGRLSAAARALTAPPEALRTPAVRDNACGLFPPIRPGLATTSSVEAEFPGPLAAEVELGRSAGVPEALPRETVADAIRRVPRGSAPGPSGHRMEHLRAFGENGQAALAGVVLLLAGSDGARLLTSLAAYALAGADLLLLCKPGGLDVDGLPRLRPIGMPQQL